MLSWKVVTTKSCVQPTKPQAEFPKLTIPARTRSPSRPSTVRGPPLSPWPRYKPAHPLTWQAPWPSTPPAHSIVSSIRPSGPSSFPLHSSSLMIGTLTAWSSSEEKLPSVLPHPGSSHYNLLEICSPVTCPEELTKLWFCFGKEIGGKTPKSTLPPVQG